MHERDAFSTCVAKQCQQCLSSGSERLRQGCKIGSPTSVGKFDDEAASGPFPSDLPRTSRHPTGTLHRTTASVCACVCEQICITKIDRHVCVCVRRSACLLANANTHTSANKHTFTRVLGSRKRLIL